MPFLMPGYGILIYRRNTLGDFCMKKPQRPSFRARFNGFIRKIRKKLKMDLPQKSQNGKRSVGENRDYRK